MIDRLYSRLSLFLQGAFEALAVNGLGLFAALVAQAVLAQALGPANFGVYSAMVSMAAVLAVVAVGGMDTALLRELPKQPAHTLELVRRAERWILVAITCGTPVLFLWTGTISATAAAGVLSVFLAASTIRQFALRGNLMVFWGRFPDIVMRPVLVAGFVILASSAIELRPVSAVALHGLATGVVYFVGAMVLRQRMRGVSSAANGTAAPVISKVDRGLWLGLSLLTMLSIELDKLIGSVMLSPIDFGHYALAARLFGFGIMATESLAMVAAPLASRMLANKLRDDVITLERQLMFVLVAMVAGIYGMILLIGEDVVAFLAPGYSDSVPVLEVLALAALAVPFILPRLAITSVVNPRRALQLQSVAILGLALCCVVATAMANGAGYPGNIGLAWGIVAGTLLRAVLWWIFGRIV